MDYSHKINGTVRPIKDHVLVTDMEHGEKLTRGGIIILDDNGKTEGIRPRWAKVHSVGPEETDIKTGTWVLVDHGRWTRGVKMGEEDVVRMVEKESILLTCDQKPI